MILVSHDRRFLENVTTRTVRFERRRVDVYDGGFKDYGEARERKAAAARALQKRADARPAKSEPRPPSPRASRQTASHRRQAKPPPGSSSEERRAKELETRSRRARPSSKNPPHYAPAWREQLGGGACLG